MFSKKMSHDTLVLILDWGAKRRRAYFCVLLSTFAYGFAEKKIHSDGPDHGSFWGLLGHVSGKKLCQNLRKLVVWKSLSQKNAFSIFDSGFQSRNGEETKKLIGGTRMPLCWNWLKVE